MVERIERATAEGKLVELQAIHKEAQKHIDILLARSEGDAEA